MELSKDEMAFALLDDSHGVACQALSEIVLEAVRASSPCSWKEEIFSCFTTQTRPAVERCLENNLPLHDIYVICKIIKRRLADIASFCGGDLSDSREKERLSLHTQGIDTARNWVFHGELVSPGEVRSSVATLILTLTKLRCREGCVQRLWQLKREIDVLLSNSNTPNNPGKYSISLPSLGRTLLYVSLRSFEKLFCKRLQNMSKESEHGVIGSLVRRIKKEIYKPKKESLLVMANDTSGKKLDKMCLTRSLDSAITIRNKLAHNNPLTLAEVENALRTFTEVLSAFGLTSGKIESALQRIANIQEQEDQKTVIVTLKIARLNSDSLEEDVAIRNRQRILRPQCLHFIGKTHEMNAIATAFSDKENYERKMVLIYGPAGIGKSYLATQVVVRLREVYPQQVWLCCSGQKVFEQDLSINSHCFSSSSKRQLFNHSVSAGSSTGAQINPKMTLKTSEQLPQKWLIVLDDVSSATVHLIFDKILDTNQAIIITTRNSTIKEEFQRKMKPVTVLNLQPFLASESRRLIMEKMPKGEIHEPSLIDCVNITRILGNLPLCVSIYSSFVAFYSTGKCRRRSQVESVSFLKGWKEIEDQFGDLFHVRGLTGVVDSAEAYLSEHPYAVFLLAKICSTDQERIPWEVINLKPNRDLCYYLRTSEWFSSVSKLLSGLFGVFDYLFSENGQRNLEICRRDLEELGLIVWNNEECMIHIHQLTLHAVQDLLAKKCLYLRSLISHSTGKPVKNSIVGSTCETVSRLLTGELLIQVLHQCKDILEIDVNNDRSYNGVCANEKVRFNVCLFLSSIMENNIVQKVLEVILPFEQVLQLFESLIFALIFGAEALELAVVCCECVRLFFPIVLRSYASPLSCNLAGFPLVILYIYRAELSWDMEYFEDAISNYQLALNELRKLGLSNSCYSVCIYISVALLLMAVHGPFASYTYMIEASEQCPRLMTEPQEEQIQNVLVHIREEHPGCNCLLSLTSPVAVKSFYWSGVLCLRLQLEKKGMENSKIEDTALRCVVLLVEVVERQRQEILEKVAHCSERGTLEDARQIKYIIALLDCAMQEHFLYVGLNYIGRSTKPLIITYSVLEVTLPTFSECLQMVGKFAYHEIWVRLSELIDLLFLRMWNVGYFSNIRKYMFSFLNLWGKMQQGLGLQSICSIQGGRDFNLSNAEWDEQIRRQLKYYSPDIGTSSGEQIRILLTALLAYGLSLLNETQRLDQAFAIFLNIANKFTTLRHKVSELNIITFLDVEGLALRHVLCLSALLGEGAIAEALEILKVPDENFNSPFLPAYRRTRETVRRLNSLLDCDYGLNNLYMEFLAAKEAFKKGVRGKARSTSLKCWKGFVQFIRSPPEEVDSVTLGTLEIIMCRILLELADYLKQINHKEKKYTSTEWFLRYRLWLAKEHKLISHFAQCSEEYEEFLMERGRWSEALEQCHLVRQIFVAEFGEDYLEWLPDALDTSFRHQQLKEKIPLRNALIEAHTPTQIHMQTED